MKILHLIDSLNPGGAERMAVGYVNALADREFEVYLWSSREEGLLKNSIHPRVNYHFLNRRGPVGIKALQEAIHLIKKEKIQLIHAHSTSFFFATLLKVFCPKLKLIWHDHYGNSENLKERKFKTIKLCSRFFDTILSVNENLRRWAIQNLSSKKVYYIKNFTNVTSKNNNDFKLSGNAGKRLVCLANLRPQKNHLNLLNAFSILKKKENDWSLHLLGRNWNDDCYAKIQSYISENLLDGSVFYYGSQIAISEILDQSDIGVLASDSEGLPLAILEYALAGLPVVCTDVGYCSEVVQGFGKVVPPGNSNALAEALLFYIQNPDIAAADAAGLQKHVEVTYTAQAVLPQVIEIYRRLLQA